MMTLQVTLGRPVFSKRCTNEETTWVDDRGGLRLFLV